MEDRCTPSVVAFCSLLAAVASDRSVALHRSLPCALSVASLPFSSAGPSLAHCRLVWSRSLSVRRLRARPGLSLVQAFTSVGAALSSLPFLVRALTVLCRVVLCCVACCYPLCWMCSVVAAFPFSAPSLAMSRVLAACVVALVSVFLLLGVSLASVNDASWPSDAHLDAAPASSGSPLFPHVLSADDMLIGDSDWDEPDSVKHVMQATGGSSGASTGNAGAGGLDINVLNFTVNQCMPTAISLSGVQVVDATNSTVGGFSVVVSLVPLTTPIVNGGSIGTLTLQYLDPSAINLTQGSTGINQATAIFFDATSLDAVNLALDSIVYTPAQGLQGTVNKLALEVSVQSSLESGIFAVSLSPISFGETTYVPVAVFPLEGTSFDNLTTAINETFTIPPIAVSNLANPDDELAVHIQATNGLLSLTSNLSGIVFEETINPLIINMVGHLQDVNRVLANLSFTSICPSGPSCTQISDAGFTITVRDFANNTECPVVAVTDCILNYNSQGNSIIEAAVFQPSVNAITLADGSVGYNVSWQPLSATSWTPTQQQGDVTAYSVAITTDPLHSDYQEMTKALEYWHVLTNLSANTDYWVEVQVWSAAGLSTCPELVIGGVSPCTPIPRYFRTGMLAPAATVVALNSVTATTITFTTTPSGSDVNSIVATVKLTNGTIIGSSPYIIIPVTVAGGAVVDVVTGLSPYTPYIITVASSNQAGMGPATSITAWTKLAGPSIIGFVASDPTNANTVQSVGDLVTLTFDMATNQPAVATMADLIALFRFSPVPLAAQFSGVWKSASQLVITVNGVSASAVAAVGVESIAVIGSLRSADGISDNSTSTATLTGNWGMFGLGSYFTLPSSPITLQENAETYLGVNTSFTQDMLNDATRTYTLSIQVLEPVLAGAALNGSSVWSTGGIFVSTSGTASALQFVIGSVVLTSPRNYFGDMSLQYQLLSGTTVIGEAVQVLNVVHVNHMPVITAPARVSVPLQTVTAVSSIVITDVDVPVGSLTDSMTVTLSASAGGNLSFSGTANSGVVYAPSFAAPSPIYQLTGPLLAVNLALKTLQLTFDYTPVSYGAPADYFLLVSANDHGNGGQPNLVNTQRVSVDITCPAVLSKVTPTTITAAALSASGNELTVTLSPAMSDSVLASPFIACASVFDASSVASFGRAAVCHYIATDSILVELGLGATVSSQSKVGIVRNAFARCGSTSMLSTAASVSATYDLTQPLAAVAISGPSMGSLCEDLTLTAVAFPSSAHALSYLWELPSYIATSPLVSALSLSSPSLTVPAEAFLELASLPPAFTFSLTVTDFLGRVQTDSLAVSFDSAAKPLLLPLTATTVRHQAEDALDLYTLASMPSCASSVFNAPPSFQVVYHWSVTPALSGVSLGSASSLHLPANVLSYSANSQHVYTFTVNASLSTNPQLVSKQEFSVVMLPSALQARIAGGLTRSVAAASAVTVDGTSSFDPIATSTTAASEYTYMWSCQAAAPQGACFGADGSVLSLNGESALVFAAGLLTANTYTFTLQYSHPSTGRADVVSQTLVVLDPYSTAVALSLNTASLVINTGDKLAVSASSSSAPLALNWSVVGSGAAHLPIDISSAVLASGSLSSFVLNGELSPSFFEAGAIYQITATATTAANESSYASTAVYVNIPPTCSGDLSLTVVESSTASTVTALSTAFVMTINSTACLDADAEQTDALLFQFFRLDSASGLYHWLTAASPVAATSDFVLPSGSSVVVGVRVTDRVGGYTEYSTTVNVAAPTGAQTVASFTNANISDAQLASEYGDAVTVAASISAVLSTAVQSSLPAAELQTLKDSLLLDVLLWSASLPDDYVTTVLADLVADSKSTSVWAANHTLAFVAAISGGDAMSASVNELRSVVAILDGITSLIVNGQGSSTGGSRRRLLAGSLDAATLNTLNTELFAALNSLSIDLSTHMLTVEGDSLPITASQLSGELRRGVVGNDSLSVSVAGSTLTVPSVSVAPLSAANSMYDVALFVTPSAAFEYVAQVGQVSEVFLVGAYAVASYSSPLAPHTVSSTLLPSLPASVNYSATLDLAYSASLAGSCLNTVNTVTGAVCSLECRQWNGTAFDKSGVMTDFLALSNTTHTARCVLTQPGVYALFKSAEVGLVLSGSSTGSSSTGNGLPVDQSNAVRASVSFPAPFTVANMRDFKLGLVQDLAAVTGEPASRFNVEQVTTNTLTGATTVILDIWVPVADGEATSQNVYLQLAGLATADVLSTSYLRYADLTSWLEQCSDLVFRAVCDSTDSSSSSSWMLPLIISASAAGFLLLCALTVLAARRYWSAPSSKDDKTLEDFTLPSATAAGAAKQYIYSPPTAGKEMDAEISRADETVSDVVLVAGTAGIDPHTAASVGAGLAEDEISEPVIVESEAEAAELAKQSDLHTASQRSADSLYDNDDKEVSVNSASASGQSRHFYYVDESVQRSELSTNSNSSNSRSAAASQSTRPSRQSVSQSKTPSHFRVGGSSAVPAAERSVSGSLSTRSASQSASRSSGTGGAHFRYSDNEDAQSTSRTPALPSLSHSPSQSAVKAEGFHSFSQLDLQAGEQQPQSQPTQPAEKKAVRVVRPGQQ